MDKVAKTRRVLVVDDDEVVRELLAAQLSAQGDRVQTASSGDEALALLQAGVDSLPEVILCDLQMPGTQAASLLRQLRDRISGATVLLAMSGSEADAGAWKGFDGFLLKPFTMTAFRQAIAQQTRLYPDSGPIQNTDKVENAIPCLDESVYLGLAAWMRPEQMQQLYAICVRDVEERVGRMRQAAEANDDLSFRAEAHGIKGGCAMVGAVELQSLASSMEMRGLEANQLASLDEFLQACDRLRGMLVARNGTEKTASTTVGEMRDE